MLVTTKLSPKRGMSTRREETAAPLDYSFLDVSEMTDLPDEHPRGGVRMPDDSHDKYGNHISPEEQEENRRMLATRKKEMEATQLAMLAQEQFMVAPMEVAKQTHVAKPVRRTTILKLNNNALAKLTDFMPVMSVLVFDPHALTMLDLSFNQFKKVPSEISVLLNLALLYLHANELKTLNDLDTVYQLPSLRGLTCHGNPVEETAGYRPFIIAACPQLTSLDFNRITVNERKGTSHIINRHGYLKKMAKRANFLTDHFVAK